MNKSLTDLAADELRRRMAGRAVSPVQFLRHFWQKRPLLVRGAFAGWRDPISRDELAGLACEEEVESRLVMERGGKKPWQVIPGPQRASRLRTLPRSHWTLLVQGVDRHVPAVAALLDPFRFIPDWRVDDVMISFAPRGGTVGPHLDSYDVFLIQGQGHRRWRLDPKAPAALRPGMDLRLLRQFHAEQEWVLNPGDMLYLPPNLAHYGVALDECLTYSIGFRSPSAMDLLSAAAQRLAQTDGALERYRDPGLHMPRQPGEIPRAAIQELRRLLEGTLRRLGRADFDDLVGELLTEPKGSSADSGRRLSVNILRSKLRRGASLVRSGAGRIGFVRQGRETVLFVDGLRYSLGRGLAFTAQLLTEKQILAVGDLSRHLGKTGFLPFLATLIRAGAYRLESNRERERRPT